MTVAVVGTGRMGAAMARRLAGAGFDLVLFNRTRETADAVARDIGASVAATAREAAAADICVVSLADDPATLATYAGDDGLLAGLGTGTVICETSTVHPQTVRELAPQVAARDAVLLDCPVSGSVPVVERGELTVMAGGDVASLDKARPVLAAFSKQVFHFGEVGGGATMKLVVNSLVAALNVALCEAVVLAEKAGLDRELAYNVFEVGAAGAPYVKYKRAAFLHPEAIPVAFSLDLVAKDLELIRRLSEEVGARSDQGDVNRRLLAEALATGLGRRDMSALAELLR
jgi:3-hydroxyisobutyrate dehydrogenase/2-hydroxy-3-oxopropionate reductase